MIAFPRLHNSQEHVCDLSWCIIAVQMRCVNIELINNMANQNCHFKLKTSIQWLYYQTSLCVCMITVNIKAALKQNCLESIKMVYTPLTGFCQREVLSYNQLETRPEIKKKHKQWCILWCYQTATLVLLLSYDPYIHRQLCYVVF